MRLTNAADVGSRLALYRQKLSRKSTRSQKRGRIPKHSNIKKRREESSGSPAGADVAERPEQAAAGAAEGVVLRGRKHRAPTLWRPFEGVALQRWAVAVRPRRHLAAELCSIPRSR